MKGPWKSVLRAIVLGTMCVACTVPLLAQRNTASVQGIVVDPGGNAVVHATVRLVDSDTAQTYPTLSDDAGRFILLQIAPGRYSLEVTISGFKQYTQRDIVLNVDDRPELKVTLAVGTASENVVVEADQSGVDATQANIGAVIDSVTTHELPLNGRQFLQLTLVLPGVTTAAGGQTVLRGGGPRNIGVQAAGNRATNNSFVIDGVDSFGFRFKNTSLQPSVASIDQFKVLESPYDPQYGVVSGLTVNLITRSGTNDIHGEVFEYFRNDVLNARNYFAAANPPYRQNQFGGTLGFPILRDKTFVFASYEGLRESQGLSSTSIVPTALEAAGNFSASATPVVDPTTGTQFPGNVIPADRISPIAAHLLSFFPAPNAAGAGYNYLNASADTIDQYQAVGRLDHTVSSKLRLFSRYTFDNVTRFTPGSIPLFGTYGFMTVQNVSLGATYVFDPNTIFDLHIGYNRENVLNQSQQIGKQKVASLGIAGLSLAGDPAVDGVPNVVIQGYTTLGDATYSPEGRVENFEQIVPNVLHTIGRHTLRLGTTIWPVQLNRVSVSGTQRGQFNFTNLYTGAATGLPDFELGDVQQAVLDTGRGREDARSILQSYYAADDFRVSPRLTVNLGLRYELTPAFVDKGNRISVFVPQGTGTIAVAGDPSNGFSGRKNRALYDTPLTRFFPRVGFAFDLDGKGKTVLRGGYGVFGNIAIFNSQFLSALNAPFVVTRTYQSNPSVGVNLQLAAPFSTNPAAGGLPGGLEFTPTFQQAYVQQWSLGVQRALTSTTALDLEYVANNGTNLDGLRTINQGALNSAANAAYYRPFQDFGTFLAADSFAYSNYQSLQAKVTRQFSHGLTFVTGYTYGHSLDNSPGEGSGSGGQSVLLDTTRPSLDYSNSDFDVRQRFTLSGVYSLPFGTGATFLNGGNTIVKHLVSDWRLSGLWQVETGFPFTVTQSGNRSGTFASTERAQLLCPASQAQGSRQRTKWFNTSCFGLSPLGTFGSSARNLMRYAGQDNVDVSLMRSFPFGEKRFVEFRGELFNALNHTQFASTGGVGNSVSTPASFGIYTSAQPARVAQFALRIVY